ncbi:MAG: hypothetical protein KME10_22480 [Plectolyngbya sp. WJT66-NPBG17]|jgi:hypothetical protein|nr:hypothetical protein [Plectolyngbya sp. WJT66-NPBG17]MBW4528566.1 hypothetical protein [Phormidium tanganyikae FI6-MK23]
MSVSIPQQVLDTLQALSLEDQKMVLDFAVNLQSKKSSTPDTSESPRSFFDVAREYIGRGEGASDLSTNPDYMKGYGEDETAGDS